MFAQRTSKKVKNSKKIVIQKKNSKISRTPTAFNTILSLQKTIGNQAVQRLIKSGTLQAKLKVGAPNDIYEQEADRVAAQVMRMGEGKAHGAESKEHGAKDRTRSAMRLSLCAEVQRICPECEEEMQRQPIGKNYQELQRQPQEEEEEKLQMQPLKDEEEVQRQPIEENEEELRRQPEEEKDKLQMQPLEEEEEVQRQPPEENEEQLQQQPEDDEKDKLQMQALEDEEEVQRQPVEDEEEEVQTKNDSTQTPEVTSYLESRIQSQKGGGQPLGGSAQEFFGEHIGADFSGVRVHTDTGADKLNRELNAKAFTTGQDIFFRQGEYNPESSKGKELVGHELTHVVQQSHVNNKELSPKIP